MSKHHAFKWVVVIILTLQTLLINSPIFAQAAAPSISEMTPSSVPDNYTIPINMTITGANFEQGKTTVTLFQGNQPMEGKITNINVVSASKVTFTLGTGLMVGDYSIRVSTPSGNVNQALKVAAPSIVMDKPLMKTGYTATTINVTGTNTNFVSGQTQVKVLNNNNESAGTASAISVTSKDKLSFTLPEGLTEGTYKVQVVTGEEKSLASLEVKTARISSLSPSSIPSSYQDGKTITVTGLDTSFSEGAAVKLLDSNSMDKSSRVSAVNRISNTSLSFTLLEGLEPGNYNVQVISGAETVNSEMNSKLLTIYEPSLNTPASLNVGYEAQRMTITGVNTHFHSSETRITLLSANEFIQNKTIIGPTSLSFDLGAGLVAGSYTLQVETGEEIATTTITVVSSSDSQPPATPSGLNVTASNQGAQLSWTANTDVDLKGYKIFQKIGPSGTYQEAQFVDKTRTSYLVQNLTNGQLYYYKIKAVDESDNVSPDSLEVSVTPRDNTAPQAPRNLTGTGVNNGVNLSWDGNSESDLVGYNVYQSSSQNGTYTKLNGNTPLTAANYAVNSLVNGTTYYFKIEAVDSSGNSQSSLPISVVAGVQQSESPQQGGGADNPSGSGGSSTPPPAETPQPPTTGTPETPEETTVTDGVATEVKEDKDGNKKLYATLDAEKLQKVMEESGKGSNLQIDLTSSNGTANSETSIPLTILDSFKEKNPTGEISLKTNIASYKLNVKEFSSEALREKGITNIDNIVVTIEEVKTTDSAEIESKKVAKVVSFKVSAVSNGMVVELKQFNDYVERELTLDTSLDPNTLAGVRVNEDGTYTSVPTVFSGKTAIIKSRSNSQYTVIQNKVTFLDISKVWNKTQIEKLASKQIIKGTKEGIFSPNDNVTRAQLAVLLVRSLGLPTTKEFNEQFTDVPKGSWFEKELTAALETGIIRGINNSTFEPNGFVTRAQAAAMINRAMNYVSYDAQKLDKSRKITQFKDVSKIGSWAKSDVEVLLQAGIMAGDKQGNFNGNAFTTRAQTAKVLDEFLQIVELINE